MTKDTTSDMNALLRCARSCITEAGIASQKGQLVYARLCRELAGRALAELDALTARATPIKLTPSQEQTKVFAAVTLQGLH